MSANRDAFLLSLCANIGHDLEVARMKTAGKVGRCNNIQHFVILTNGVRTKALTHIAVNIDRLKHGDTPLVSW